MMHLVWVVPADHIDADYYDRFFVPAPTGRARAAHMATWHR